MPDIPRNPGSALSDLGRGMMQLGAGLSDLSTSMYKQDAAVAKVYQDAAATTEYLKAKRYLDDQTALFFDQISRDPNHNQYVQKWYEFQDPLKEGMGQFLTLPKSKVMADEAYTKMLSEQTAKVRQAALTGLRLDAEGTAANTLNTQMLKGDVTGVMDTIDKGFEGGIFSGSKENMVKEFVPKAQYNKVFSALVPLTQQQRLEVLNDPNSQSSLGLDINQIQAMSNAFEQRQKLIDAEAKNAIDRSNGDIEMDLSDKVIQYRIGGIKAAGFDSPDQMLSYVSKQNWQGDKRADLQLKWANEFTNAVERGATQNDPNQTSALWDIALNINPSAGPVSPEKKTSLIFSSAHDKVTGEKLNEILKATDDMSRNPAWQPFITGVRDHFEPLLTAYGQAKDVAKVTETSYQKEIAINAMLSYMRNHPNDTHAWQSKLDELKIGNISKTLNDKTTAALTTPGSPPPIFEPRWQNILGIPGFNLGNKMSDEMKMEVARQMSPSDFAQDPTALPSWKTALPNIQNEMRQYLPKSAQDAVATTSSDNTTYFKKGSDIYTVKAANIGGTIKNQVWKAIYENGVFKEWKRQ